MQETNAFSTVLKFIASLINIWCTKKVIISFLFSIFLCAILHLWLVQILYYFTDDFNIIMSVARRQNMIKQYPTNATFILVWNEHNNVLQRFGIKNGLLKCSLCDCVITDDKNLLYDYTRYDGIIFNEFSLSSNDRPNRRSKIQVYVFSSQKSSNNAPACALNNENFFNLTFTYKLDSDVVWSYIAVQNLSGATIAPAVSVDWEKSLKPVSSDLRAFLIQKKKAAIWIVNDDKYDDTVVEYITRLQEHLFHYSLKVDVYGPPPLLKCLNKGCLNMIRDKYYFYMAFESSISEDHVTDIVLNGYNNYAVPVVYGGANYSRFLPPDSYINARNFHPYNLAYMMYQAINDPNLYEGYFRWTNLYTVHDNSKSLVSLCNLCDTIHRYKTKAIAKQPMKQFRHWWNSLNGMKRCLSQEYWKESVKINHRFHFE